MGQAIDPAGQRAKYRGEPRVGFDIHQGDQGGLQRLAPPTTDAVPEKGQHIEFGHQVWRALMDAFAPAQDLVQPRVFGPGCIHRGQRFRALTVAIELVPRVSHARQAEQTGVQRFFQQAFHLL